MLVISPKGLTGKIELGENERVALVGRSGSGKTLSIKTALCLNSGLSMIDDKSFCETQDFSIVNAVFQEPNTQILSTSLEEELKLISRYHPVDLELAKQLMGKYFTRDFFKLSDGYKRRYVISSVLSFEPKYVLLDEPFANVDREGTSLIAGIIPRGSLIAEHRIPVIREIVDRAYVIEDGRIEEIKKDKLFDEDFLRKNGLRGFKVDKIDTDKGKELLNVNVRGINLRVREGEIVCLVGRNGSGKTTLIKSLAGKIYAIFQNPDLQFFYETVEREVGDDETMRKLGLYKLRERSPYALSYGEKMRVLIASALASKYKVVALDEPTAGLDGVNLISFVELLGSVLNSKRGVIIATHDEEIINICDKIINLS
ncbi:ABC transporter ATP-binding protein [Sulfolobales archaeon HS-7]|nr:ABC transporter ATP-binding protein [Sulfolobales archaeon HS-7]